jgi:hypothetical protein
MDGPAELYSIVIVGSMNPRIHHPAWYEAVRILSAEEARAAVLTACVPMFSQFHLPGFNISCMQDRWEIQTQDPKNCERILDIAGRTFDTLEHTPISSFGLNFHFVRPTGLQDVGRRLAELVNTLPLGRKATESDATLIVTTTTLPDRTLQETVLGAPEAAGYVRLLYNVQHPIKPQPQVVIFKLAPLLNAAFQEDYPECRGRADQVAKALAGAQKE